MRKDERAYKEMVNSDDKFRYRDKKVRTKKNKKYFSWRKP